MIANKVYTRDEMREEHIITSDYRFIDKEGEYFAKLIMRAEASKNMMRLFFQLSDGRKIITPVFWWQSYLGFYEIDNGTNLRLIYERNGKGIALKKIEILLSVCLSAKEKYQSEKKFLMWIWNYRRKYLRE